MSMIKTKKLTFEYIHRDEEGNVEGITKAVNGVDLDIKEGDFIAILGHNGSGKSTLAKHMNAVLLPGGGDMDPKFYGQARIPACGEPNLLRDAAEPPLLRAFLAADKPVLAICRGIQLMNVVLGGTLYHLLFEAKAQYAYPYMVYMLPLAAMGLCALAEKLKKVSG